ncbi:DUF2283 domain-containing protein [Candidatus Woesearchaeota archaeon]|nr:DUF2283 domain-containing protein [Candidatus Woesearchaeota archaeon]
MKIEYDQDADALYIYLRNEKVDHSKNVDDNTVIDFDEKGKVIGIEILFVKERNPELLKELKFNNVVSA